MKCPSCGKEITDNAKFCRYCGESVNEEIISEEAVIDDSDVQHTSKKKWIILAAAIVILLAAAGTVYFTQFHEKEVLSDSVESIDLKNFYALEDDAIVLDYPTVQYTDGTSGEVKKYTVYVNGEKCKNKKGKVILPKDISSGKCTLRLEWEKGGKTEYCEKKIKVKGSNDDPKDKGTTGNSPKDTPEVNLIGNTLGNLGCDGLLAQQGEWLYYSKGQMIYRAKKVGKDEKVVCEASGVIDINVIGDWLYYCSSDGICKIKTDGTGKECIYKSDQTCEEMVVYENTIYFRTGDDTEYSGWMTGDIYTMNTDGSDVKLFLEGELSLVGIETDDLYYYDNDRLCRINLDGTDESVILENKSVSTLAIEDGWIYATLYDENSSTEYMISRINIESGKIEKIRKANASHSDWAFPLNIKDGWIYYLDIDLSSSSEGATYSVAKVKNDGTGYEVLLPAEEVAYPFVTDNSVYTQYSDYGDNGEDETYIWEKAE